MLLLSVAMEALGLLIEEEEVEVNGIADGSVVVGDTWTNAEEGEAAKGCDEYDAEVCVEIEGTMPDHVDSFVPCGDGSTRAGAAMARSRARSSSSLFLSSRASTMPATRPATPHAIWAKLIECTLLNPYRPANRQDHDGRGLDSRKSVH